MKKMAITAVTLIVIFFLISIVKSSTDVFDTFFMGEKDIISKVVSPDGNYVAYVFESSGGATTEFTYRLSIMKNGEKLKSGDKGNTYVSCSKFTIGWEDKNTLVVNNNPDDEIFKQERNFKDISIIYRYINGE